MSSNKPKLVCASADASDDHTNDATHRAISLTESERILLDRLPDPIELGNDAAEYDKIKKAAAFLWCVKHPGHPPSTNFDLWPLYDEYLSTLESSMPEWSFEHNKFVSASTIGTVLGLNHNTTRTVYWKECCTPSKEKGFWWLRMCQRGNELEDVARKIYEQFCLQPGEMMTKACSVVHPEHKWIMATPDGIVKSRSSGVSIRNIEIKCPLKRAAFLDVPAEYMAQIQFAMEVAGLRECDFMSLSLNDSTLASVFIVHRVKFNKEYIRAALPIIREFEFAVLTKTKPPIRCGFDPTRFAIETEQVLRLENVIHLIPNGAKIAREAINDSYSKAETKCAASSAAFAVNYHKRDHETGDAQCSEGPDAKRPTELLDDF